MTKFKKRFSLGAVSSLLALAPAAYATTDTFDGNTFWWITVFHPLLQQARSFRFPRPMPQAAQAP